MGEGQSLARQNKRRYICGDGTALPAADALQMPAKKDRRETLEICGRLEADTQVISYPFVVVIVTVE